MKSNYKKQKSALSEKEVLQFLKQVETGEITLTAIDCIPQDVYAGDVPYMASNGWKIVVFNDCGDWDYLDSVHKGGQSIEFSEMVHTMPAVSNYRPSDEVAWTRYGIPGYITFRCAVCGKEIKTWEGQDYLCYEHKTKE